MMDMPIIPTMREEEYAIIRLLRRETSSIKEGMSLLSIVYNRLVVLRDINIDCESYDNIIEPNHKRRDIG